MTRFFGTVSDRLLSAVLKEQSAGACVPEHGEKCYCKGGYKYVYNCNGHCTKDVRC
jgi:hypothetical protein